MMYGEMDRTGLTRESSKVMQDGISILFVEESAADAAAILHHLEAGGLSVDFSRVETAERMSVALRDQAWDVILCDYRCSDFSVPGALALLKATGLDIPFIVVSGAQSEEAAVEMMKAGATDYVSKNDLRRLVPGIQREIAEARDRAAHVVVEVGSNSFTEDRQVEDQLRTVSRGIAFAPVSIMITDRRGNIEYVNRKFVEVTGYEFDEVRGKNPRLQKSGGTPAGVYAQLWSAITRGKTWYGEFYNRRKNGEFYWENAFISPVYDGHGQITQFIAVKEDITEKKKIQDVLRESEERFRLISENIADIILLFEPTGKCIYASPSLVVLGHNPEAMKDRSVFTLIHPDDRAGAAEQIAELEETFAPRATAIRLSTQAGEWREMEASLSLLISDAGYRVVAVVRDVSERKEHERRQEALLAELTKKNREVEETLERLTRMQEGLVQSEKMASLGKLTAGIAHEINNPLAFVSSNMNRFNEYYADVRSLLEQWRGAAIAAPTKGFSPSVLAQLQKETDRVDLAFVDQDFTELMEHTRKGVSRIKRTVEQLRGFAHFTQSEFGLADINHTLDEAVDLVWNELKYNVTVEKLYGDIPPTECNAGELQQVFVNILVNAAHAIPEKGTVTITTRAEGAEVVIVIADTGQGIPEEHLKHIFDPFFTTKPIGKGTGLGLWIVSTIIQKHQGHIDVVSSVGKGATFTMRLPVCHAEERRIS